MATVCNQHPDVRAVFLGTFLANGETVALCDECMVPWCAAVLHAMSGVDPAPFIAAVSEPPSSDLAEVEQVVPGNDGEDAAAVDPTPRTSRSGRTRSGSAVPRTGTGDAASPANPKPSDPAPGA